MIALFYYLLKVIFCSGILYGYFHLALRNKVFHEWNRFYLLAIIPLSVLLPLLDIIIIAPADHDSKIITAMQLVAGADEYITDVNSNSRLNISWEWMGVLIYALVSITVLTIFAAAIIKITNMIKKYTPVYLDDVLFLNTKEHGTPFSFFKYLLWNEEISPDSETGKRIMEHELVHIREKHSWDKVFVHLSLVFFWINPFFWLVRKELAMIHEFIADRRTVGSGDVKAFAKLILQASFPQHASLMTNSFFQSSIKRRLSMINKHNTPRFNYLSRLMMIPVLFMLVFTFGVKAKTLLSDPIPTNLKLDKKYTVVVDAGHGGEDAGAVGGSLKEKDLALSMALLVKSLSKNPNINIIPSRSTDVRQSVKDKVAFTEQAKADLFLSIHINSAPSPDSSGIMAYISGRSMTQNEQNIRFASLLLNNLSQVYKTDQTIRQRTSQGVWILDENKCPAAIIECGFISNKGDRTFISNSENQKKIAEKIVVSIEEYFSENVRVTMLAGHSSGRSTNTDTIPAQKKEDPKKLTFIDADSQNETLTNTQYQKKTGHSSFTFMADSVFITGAALSKNTDTGKIPMNTIYRINGQQVSADIANSIDPSKIASIHVDKKDDKGIITITLKDGATKTTTVTDPSKPKEVTVVGYAKQAQGSNKEVTVVGYAKPKEKSNNVVTVKGYKASPIHFIDGKESTQEEVDKLDPNTIEAINVLKGESATKKYGEKAKNGVVEITLKK